ncbi:uncharacterized protein LOC135146415 [Zophobas morio]|uniref:uncharacterized protein LOC135146415 n=1 Tax=Zophobas morio TaxID=2755281 RepID=UPI0030832F23
MHIKQVAIVGFTSYEYATYTSDNKGSPYVEEFDPKFNVIVGKNGSGKSNFLKAIRFVLHDMRSVAGLRHQRDDGHIAPSGYVQITFDNTDRTIPIDEDEVVLRRTLGMKKGEYYLNKKMTSKEDVMNLLETAGFSRSNPYYIVQQGKIMALTNAKPEDRLELLKEVAGTRVYEERRKESLSILESSDAKADKIKNVLNYIEERLVELEEEKNELKRYQQLDKQKRILEYVLYEKELQEIQSNLDDVEILYSKDNDRSSKENDLLIKIYSDSESAREKYKAITSDKDVLLANRISKKEELEGAIKKRVKLELELSDLINDEAEKEQKKKQVYEELAILKSTINKKREEYKSFLPLYEKVKAEEAVAIQKLESAELRRQELLTKQGRSKQFTKKEDRRSKQFTKKEDRDIYIKEQLHLFRKKLNEKLSLFEEEQQNYETTELQSKKLAETLKFQIKGLEETKKNIEYSEQQITKKRKLRDEALNEQKKFWAKQKQLERELETVKVDLQRAKRYQETTMNKSHFHALSAVKRIVRNNNIEGYFGPVIENFACDRLFNTAVEVSSGNRLYLL